MRRGLIDLSTRTPLSIARLSASAPSSHDLSLAAFTISMAESSFRHTQPWARNTSGTCGLSVHTRSVKMKVTWKQLFGLSVAMLLLGSGVWANVGDGSLSQNKGAWVSHAVK